MSNPAPAASGLFDSLRRLLDTALGIGQTRLELFASELEQEKLRLIDAFVAAAVGLLLLSLGLVLLIFFVVMLFWEGYRLPAMAVLIVLFGAGGIWMLLRARSRLASGDKPFALSLEELRQDRGRLRPPPAP